MSFLTVTEVAKTLRISAPTVRKLIASGELEAVYIGSQSRIADESFDAYLRRNRSTSTQAPSPVETESGQK